MSSVIRPRSNSCPNLIKAAEPEKLFPDTDPFIPDIKDRIIPDIKDRSPPRISSRSAYSVLKKHSPGYVPLEKIFAAIMGKINF